MKTISSVRSASSKRDSGQQDLVTTKRGRAGRYKIDLPAHMAQCDTNYLRLNKLFPNLLEEDKRSFNLLQGGQPLQVQLTVLERSPYTTLIRLMQLDADASSPKQGSAKQSSPKKVWSRRPQLTVRLYHDARSAEVVEYRKARQFRAVYEYPNDEMRQPDEKAQINRYLGEFLSQCLDRGLVSAEPVGAGD